MALDPLATPQDLADYLNQPVPTGGELTQQQRQLAAASNQLRGIIGQPVSRHTSVVTLFGEKHGVVRLPAFPVVAVNSLTVRGHPVSEFKIRRTWLYSDFIRPDDEIVVDYTHGFSPTPEEIVYWTCVLAQASIAATRETGALGLTAGVASRSEQIDDYQVTNRSPSEGSSPSGGLSLPSGVTAHLKATYGGGLGYALPMVGDRFEAAFWHLGYE